MDIKILGQVFTPQNIVNDILDVSGYFGEQILKKHVIDNSCGDGAFLIGFLKRYIDEYIKANGSLENIKEDLETYIHGVEIDKKIYENCINKLNKFVNKYDIYDINWDILNANCFDVTKYNGKIDYVIGNPPYVRVHNLSDQYENCKKYSFCTSGMIDLYIVFYEIGLKMMSEDGVLCYITPNSFYNSLAGSTLRNYLKEKQNMELIMDLGHYQPFIVNTYTTICKICNNQIFDSCKYYKYDIETQIPKYICDINYDDLFIDNKIILSTNNSKYNKYLNYEITNDVKVQVKNGFATLNDKIFIQDNFDFEGNVINIVKASTGNWKKCIYPYDKNGCLIKFNDLDEAMQEYLINNRDILDKDNTKKDSLWYAFGRSQGIKDVWKERISINTTIKDINSIKLNRVKPGEGIYSGLYILTDLPYELIEKKVCSNEFIEYLSILNKCKSGGYYTISSKDLAKFINCILEE